MKEIEQGRIIDFIPNFGDICLVQLHPVGKYCLKGNHYCVIYDKVGPIFNVVPITKNQGKLYHCEYPIQKGRCGLYKNSKLKLDQIQAVSEEQIIDKLSRADKGILSAIGKYLITEANKIYKKIA